VLKLEILDEKKQSFVITSDEPVRIVVGLAGQDIICYGYRGVETDMEQDPDVLFVNFPEGPDYMLGDNPNPYVRADSERS
jgi:hypothetical protein